MKGAVVVKKLVKLNSCTEAVAWVREHYPGSNQKAWVQCERGDWMLWLLGKLAGPVGSKSRKKLVLTVCECVGRARVPTDRSCLETTKAYCRGKTTLKKVIEARASSPMSAATYAASVAYTSSVSSYASYAAYAAYSAFAPYTSSDSHKKALKQGAKIIRKRYPRAPKL